MGEYCCGKFQACKTALESPENYDKLDQHTEQIQMPARKYPVGLGFLPSGNVRRQARPKRSRMPLGPLLLFHFQVSPVFDHIILKCCDAACAPMVKGNLSYFVSSSNTETTDSAMAQSCSSVPTPIPPAIFPFTNSG